jgi:uncharacterized membrane protein
MKKIFSGKDSSLLVAILGLISLFVAAYMLLYYTRNGTQFQMFLMGVYIILAAVVSVNNYKRYRRLKTGGKDRDNAAEIT